MFVPHPTKACVHHAIADVIDWMLFFFMFPKGSRVTVIFDVPANRKTPKLSCMKSKIRMSPDFDEPLEDFAEL